MKRTGGKAPPKRRIPVVRHDPRCPIAQHILRELAQAEMELAAADAAMREAEAEYQYVLERSELEWKHAARYGIYKLIVVDHPAPVVKL